MPTINELSATNSLSAGDQIPVFVQNQGDTRKASLTVLAQLIGSINGTGGGIDPTVLEGLQTDIDTAQTTANTALSTANTALEAAGTGGTGGDSTFIQAGTGAVARTGQDKMRDAVSVKDFGAVCDGVANDAVALTNANARAVAAGVPLLIPGVVHVGSAVTVTAQLVDKSQQMFSATSSVTIDNGLPVRPEWFGNNMDKALSAVPAAGGTLLLAEVVYPPFASPIRRDKFAIVGTRRPRFKIDNTGLESGSIIKGPFDFRGDDITLENFGVDSGSAVCTALYAGAAKEGFLSGLPVTTRSKNLRARSLISICKAPLELVHAFALEGYTDAEIHNLDAQYGVHGIAIKATASNVSNLRARGCGYNGVIIKTDTAQTTTECTNVVNIVCESVDTFDGGGLRITNNAGGQVLTGVNIKNVVCNRTKYGIDFDCNDSHVIDSVNIDGAFFYVCQTYGFKNNGSARRCKVSNAVAFNCGTQGFITSKALFSGSFDYLSEVDFFHCIAANCTNGFELYGRNLLSHCRAHANTGWGFYAASGSRVSRIACVGGANPSGDFGPSNAIWYAGNTAEGVRTPTLLNSWVQYGVVGKQPAGYYLTDDGIVHLTGLVKFGLTGSPIFNLPVGFRPQYEVWFLTSSLATGTGVLTPAHVVVQPSGDVIMQPGGGTDFLSLDGISFRMDLT